MTTKAVEASSSAQGSAGSGASATAQLRGGPFTIPLLNRILLFAAETAKDAVLRYGLVCKQWSEAEMLYAQDMWQALSRARWGERLRGSSWSHYAYEQRARAARAAQASDMLNEVENCGGAAHGHQFRFRCPLIAANMRVTDEAAPGNGGSVLFCDVCSQRVFPVTNEGEIQQAQSERRCVLITAEAAQQMRARSGALPADMFNIAVITTQPAPALDGSACDTDAATQLLRLCAAQAAARSSVEGTARTFLSRDLLICSWGSYQLHLNVVRVPPLPANYDRDNSDHAARHPCAPGNALSAETMPTSNGWNRLLAIDAEACRIVQPHALPAASDRAMHALALHGLDVVSQPKGIEGMAERTLLWMDGNMFSLQLIPGGLMMPPDMIEVPPPPPPAPP